MQSTHCMSGVDSVDVCVIFDVVYIEQVSTTFVRSATPQSSEKQ